MSELAEQERSKRQTLAAPGGQHDRIVRILRVVLPSIIGALIAILAFSPFAGTRELSFVLAKDGVNLAQERMRLTNALYRGEDSAGQPFSIRAGSAVQKSSAEPILRLSDLSARILMQEGPASIIAAKGIYDLDREVVRVNGPLSYNSASGYSLVASNVELALKTRQLQSFAPVNGKTKLGSFRADSMSADLDKHIIRLHGNVQLRIDQNKVR